MPQSQALLVQNVESSSLKFAVLESVAIVHRLISGSVERIGLARSRTQIADETGGKVVAESAPFETHEQALNLVAGTNGRAHS